MVVHVLRGARHKLTALLATTLLTFTIGLVGQVDRADAHHKEYCGLRHSAGYSHGLQGGYYWSQFAYRWSGITGAYRVYVHVNRTGQNFPLGEYFHIICEFV